MDTTTSIMSIETISNTKSRQLAEDACYILIIIFNLSTWIDINSVWIELPLLVHSAPEHWTLPSTLSLVISLANIFPLIVTILRWKLADRFSEIPFIYLIIIIGIIACCSIALFWNSTVYVFEKERSIPLITAVFTLAILDCTSSLVFFDYMQNFKAKYLRAMFLGESLTGILPTLIAIPQGFGGEPQCIINNSSRHAQPLYREPRFSISTFFFLITGIIIISLIAFVILRFTSIVKLAKAHDKHRQQSNTECYEKLLVPKENGFASEKISLSKSNSMTQKQFFILQIFNVINSAIAFGCLPALITYVLLPYGQKVFYYASILLPVCFPLAALYGFIRPTLSTFWTSIGLLPCCLISAFFVFVAFQSPCPIWADTIHGGIILITLWFSVSFVLAYIRISNGNQIKLAWAKGNGLFYFGLSIQLGMIVGVIPIYLIINVYQLLHDRKPCEIYCL